MAYCIWKSYKSKIDPFACFAAFKDERNCFFLDSSLNADPQGRFSLLGINPFYIFKTKEEEPFKKLKELMERFKISPAQSGVPFSGGAVGYLAYDLGFLLEKKLKKKTPDDLGLPDCFFGFYNTAIIIDNLKKELHIASLGFPEKNSRTARALAKENLKKIENLLSRAGSCSSKTSVRPKASSELKSNFSRGGFIQAVDIAKRYIKEGDIYQVNLSQRFEARSDLSGFEIYRALRRLSPSYFGAFLDAGDFQILSSSPERFLRLEGSRVITRPMKGTRPRGETTKEDTALRKQLLKSPKDKAELIMIVDLERNDLGRVCNYDSIKVTALRELERYSTVYQTTSTVEGKLFEDKNGVDLLRACFPGGSITGCPKIRAMEIIEELEPTRRSIYTGALGYLSFSGDMDFNILIRTILKKKNRLYFGTGGGIVTDSVPEKEYEETLVKARAMMEAIGCRHFPS